MKYLVLMMFVGLMSCEPYPTYNVVLTYGEDTYVTKITCDGSVRTHEDFCGCIGHNPAVPDKSDWDVAELSNGKTFYNGCN